jgi:acyl-CoA synthetase (NDP forming)
VTLQFGNPVTVFETLLVSMAADPGVDAVHIQIPEQLLMLPRETLNMFHRLPEAGKPLVLWVVGMEPGVHETLRWLEDHQIPVFPSPEKAIRALTALHRIYQRSPRFRLETHP